MLCIIAPTWRSAKKYSRILLSGKSKSKLSKPEKARRYSGNGEHGLPGAPGGASGSFVGVGKEFHIDVLMVEANGGDGQNGQDGGDGNDGKKGVDASVDSTFYHCNHYYSWEDAGNYWKCFGSPGSKGGDGGKGGKGGIGGVPGKVEILFLENKISNIKIKTDKGNPGKDGTPGKAGLGGYYGDTQSAQYKVGFYTNEKNEPNNRRSESGNTYSTEETNMDGMRRPEAIEDINNYIGRFSNDFKFYLEDCLVNNYTRRRDYNFLVYLFKHSYLRKYYTLLDMIEEFLDLEKHFFYLEDKVDLLEIYITIQKFIMIRGEIKLDNEDKEEIKKVLSYLFTSVQSKVCTIQESASGKFIANLDSFLKMFMENVRVLRETQAEVTINNYNAEYKGEIDKKIEEAQEIVSTRIIPLIQSFVKKIKSKVDQLMEEIILLQHKLQEQQIEMTKKLSRLEKAFGLSIIAAVFQAIAAVAQFIPVIGGFAAAACKVASMVPDHLADVYVGGELDIPEFSINMLQDGSKFADDLLEALEDADKNIVGHYDNQKKNISAEIMNAPSSVKEMYESVLSSTAATLVVSSTKTVAHSTQVTVSTRKSTQASRKRPTKGTKEIGKKTVTNFGKAAKGLGSVLSSVTKIRDIDKKIDVLKTKINASDEQIKKLEELRDKVQSQLIPVVQNLGKFVDNLYQELTNKSAAALDFQKWSLKSQLTKVKNILQLFTKGFTVEDDIQDAMNEILSSIDPMIDIFQKVQTYKDNKMLGDYMANLNSAHYRSVVIKDHKLAEALLKLKFNLQSNVILLDYKHSMNQLKLFVFPLAKIYFEKFSMPEFLEKEKTVALNENYLNDAIQEIETYKKNILRSNVYVTKYDKLRQRSMYYSNFRSVRPFYIWHGRKYGEYISKVFAGESVILRANIDNNTENALKFNYIHIQFRTLNNQNKLDNILKNFRVVMKHFGNNYYKCDNKTYVVITESQEYSYTLEKYNDKPVKRNLVYEKLNFNEFMLSPYATWKIQLENTTSMNYYDQLEEYGDYVDMELVGIGEYFEQDVNLCKEDLEQFYDLEDVSYQSDDSKNETNCHINDLTPQLLQNHTSENKSP